MGRSESSSRPAAATMRRVLASVSAAARVATERLVSPADIGAAVRFCLETEGLTGANIAVDNGSLVMS